jgi:hypothetical protein
VAHVSFRPVSQRWPSFLLPQPARPIQPAPSLSRVPGAGAQQLSNPRGGGSPRGTGGGTGARRAAGSTAARWTPPLGRSEAAPCDPAGLRPSALRPCPRRPPRLGAAMAKPPSHQGTGRRHSNQGTGRERPGNRPVAH